MDEAEKIGFAPHRMTATMLPIFFDVDVTECTETFEFGRDGKPTYIAGPYESDVQQMEILNTLSKLGGTNFNFVAAINGDVARNLKSFRAYDDDGDLDEYEDDFEAEYESSNTIDSTATVVDVPSKE
jgi:hypothetical protein